MKEAHGQQTTTTSGDAPRMEFKALHVAALTEEVATNLETLLSDLSGVEGFTITLETQELSIVFDEEQLSFRELVQEMAEAGCPLQNINAALLLA